MSMQTDELTNRIRRLLDRLVESRRSDKQTRERVDNAVAAQAKRLPRKGVLPALDAAIGKSKKRRKEAVYILSELADMPGAVERMADWIKDPDPDCRSWIIQNIGAQQIIQLAPLLNEIIENDPDDFCRMFAIHAAGTLRSPANLPTLLRLAAKYRRKQLWSLTVALMNYGLSECRPFLLRVFKDAKVDDGIRVIAAWGLAKLGNKQAYNYLKKMVYDSDQELRAAQAICDINEWRFEWNTDYVKTTRENLESAHTAT